MQPSLTTFRLRVVVVGEQGGGRLKGLVARRSFAVEHVGQIVGSLLTLDVKTTCDTTIS